MKNSDGSRNPRSFIIICVALIAIASLPLLSRAGTVSTSVNIINNSGREIRNVYTSHVDADDWSADVLTQPLASGQSANVGNIACDGQSLKVIAEDEDGCFLSTVISCGQASTWTVDSDTTKDCGY